MNWIICWKDEVAKHSVALHFLSLSTLRKEGTSTLTLCCVSASLAGALNQFLTYQWAMAWGCRWAQRSRDCRAGRVGAGWCLWTPRQSACRYTSQRRITFRLPMLSPQWYSLFHLCCEQLWQHRYPDLQTFLRRHLPRVGTCRNHKRMA